MASATLKEAAQRLGVNVGCGPVDDYATDPAWRWPASLTTPNDPGANIIKQHFTMLDLCIWAVEHTDFTHYGRATWLGPQTYDFTGTDRAAQFARDNGMRISIPGPEYQGPPAWVSAGNHTAEQRTALLYEFYDEVFSRYSDAYVASPCNELMLGGGDYWYQNTSIGAAGGKSRAQYFDALARRIHANAPNVKIIFNQNGCVDSDPVYTGLIEPLLAMGTPFHGIGEQSHMMYIDDQAHDYAWLDMVSSGVARARAHGLEVHITEIDVNSETTDYGENKQGQLNRYYDMFKHFSEIGIRDISVWGARDPNWQGYEILLFGTDLQPKAELTYSIAGLDAATLRLSAEIVSNQNGVVTLGGLRDSTRTITVTET
jgi:hypothetical protein